MMKSQDSAESRQKEQERIMLQNLQERLERKKVILCLFHVLCVNGGCKLAT